MQYPPQISIDTAGNLMATGGRINYAQCLVLGAPAAVGGVLTASAVGGAITHGVEVHHVAIEKAPIGPAPAVSSLCAS
jgi:hypothetical protein